MTDQPGRPRQWPSDLDVQSGKTLKLNGASEPEEPITRRIPVQSVAKQRIILLARDVRGRLATSAIAQAFGESTVRGMNDINETLDRLSSSKEPTARVIDYRGVDPFKAEVARALGHTELCHTPPADAVTAYAEVSDAELIELTDHTEAEEEEVSGFARTTELFPPPELEHLLHLHEETRRSLAEPVPTPEPKPEPDLEETTDEAPERSRTRLMLGGVVVLALLALGNWPLSAQLVQANLSGYSGAHELTSTVTARVANVLVAVGDHVTTGQPVLRLEQPPALAEPTSVDTPEVSQLEQALHAGETRVEAQRGVVATLEAKRDRLMEAASATPAKLSAIDDLVDAARGQLRALESELLRTRQALAATQPVRLHDDSANPPKPPAALHASHGGIVVHVLTVPGASLELGAPILSVLGDAAVPALIITCSEQEAELLLESPEVVLTVADTKLTVLVTRLIEPTPGAAASDDDRRTIELALHDTAQLAELAKRAEIGMPVVIELPEQRTLLTRASRWLRQEFQ